MRLSELLGLPVHTAAGLSLGHVHEVRAEFRERPPRLTAIIVGRRAVLERLGLLSLVKAKRLRRSSGAVIPWQNIIELGEDKIVVADEAATTP